MPRLSLSRKKEGVLPEAILVEGHSFPINADFRNILKMIRLFEDREVADFHKGVLACSFFYLEKYPEEPLVHMMKFISGKDADEQEEKTEQRQQTFCYEFDADEIYASFLQQYQIDLFDIEFLHWYKFQALFSGLGEDTPFVRKVQLRTLDTKNTRDRSKAEAAKRSVQIPKKGSVTEMTKQSKLEAALREGKDVTQLLKGG